MEHFSEDTSAGVTLDSSDGAFWRNWWIEREYR